MKLEGDNLSKASNGLAINKMMNPEQWKQYLGIKQLVVVVPEEKVAEVVIPEPILEKPAISEKENDIRLDLLAAENRLVSGTEEAKTNPLAERLYWGDFDLPVEVLNSHFDHMNSDLILLIGMQEQFGRNNFTPELISGAVKMFLLAKASDYYAIMMKSTDMSDVLHALRDDLVNMSMEFSFTSTTPDEVTARKASSQRVTELLLEIEERRSATEPTDGPSLLRNCFPTEFAKYGAGVKLDILDENRNLYPLSTTGRPAALGALGGVLDDILFAATEERIDNLSKNK
jgi:hypothetical protein